MRSPPPAATPPLRHTSQPPDTPRCSCARPARPSTRFIPRPRLAGPRDGALPDHRERRARRPLQGVARGGLPHRRHRVHAREHLPGAALPGAGRPARRRAGRRGPAGRGDRPRAALRPAGAGAGAQGLPRRAAGRGGAAAAVRRGAAAALRHPDRRDGLRLRRSGRLRDAGGAARARAHRQDPALHRLVAPAADRAPAALRALRREPPAHRLREALGGAGAHRTAPVARRGACGAHRPRHLRGAAGGGLAADQGARGQPALSRGAARGRGLARARGVAARRAPRLGPARYRAGRGRGAAPAHGAGARQAALGEPEDGGGLHRPRAARGGRARHGAAPGGVPAPAGQARGSGAAGGAHRPPQGAAHPQERGVGRRPAADRERRRPGADRARGGRAGAGAAGLAPRALRRGRARPRERAPRALGGGRHAAARALRRQRRPGAAPAAKVAEGP